MQIQRLLATSAETWHPHQKHQISAAGQIVHEPSRVVNLMMARLVASPVAANLALFASVRMFFSQARLKNEANELI